MRVEELPTKVTPFVLRAADSMCPRRLASELQSEPGTTDPVNRARVRNGLLDAIRAWHETGDWIGAPGLVAEERAVIAHAARWYEHHFPDRAVQVTLPVESPTALTRRQVLLGGWVDLGVVHADGTRELRQLLLRSRPAPGDPLEDPAVRLAVLRLACLGWMSDRLVVTAVDLISGSLTRTDVGGADDVPVFAGWLDERVAVARGRADAGTAVPGRDCATCRFVPRCPAHHVRASMLTRRDALVPGLLSISPTSLATWNRCRRQWRDRALLNLPLSDPPDGASHGLLLHQLLHLVHRTGSCHDAAHVDDVLAAHGADARTVDEVRRHATRCPRDAETVGHEVEWARAHSGPPVFLATARFDAVWAHDGILDVRDYKSGRVAEHPVDQDIQARLQAWVAAPHAAALGLRLRVRYEHLATEVLDDPDPWEPTDEDLAGVEAQLTTLVGAMLAERAFSGVNDARVCAHCGYRSICDESAAPGVPSWPVPTGAPSRAGPPPP
jgi:PD-(D/E)XK nuclease superfamily